MKISLIYLSLVLVNLSPLLGAEPESAGGDGQVHLKVVVSTPVETLPSGQAPGELTVLARYPDGSLERRTGAPKRSSEGSFEIEARWPCRRDENEFVVTLLGGGLVSPPLSLGPMDCDSKARLVTEVQSAGKVAGQVAVTEPSRLPESGLMFREPCGELPNRPPFVFFDPYPVELAPSGEFRGMLPEGCHRLKLELPGYQIERLGQTVASRGQTTDFGTIVLEPSYSAIKFSVADPAGSPVPHAIVQVHSQNAPRGAITRAFEGQWTEPAIGAWKTDSKGRLELTSLPEGEFFFGIFSPSPEHSFNFVGPWHFGAEASKAVHVELPGWTAMTIGVDGEPEQLEAAGSPTVSIVPMWLDTWIQGAMRQYLVDPWVPTVSISKVPAARYLIQLESGEPGGRRYTVASTERTVATLEDPFILLELPSDGYFTGRALLRGEALPGAKLQFQAVEGSASNPLLATTDEEGGFRILVSDLGRYRVDVVHEASSFSSVVRDVELIDPSDEVILDVPASAITGMVKDIDGFPVTGAAVTADTVLEPSRNSKDGIDASRMFQTGARTDAQGRFELPALPGGVWEVHAQAPGFYSERRRVDLPVDETRDIVLRLQESASLRGRLVDAAGKPLADVGIGANWLAGDSQIPESRFVKSDARGEFELPLRAREQSDVHLSFHHQGLPFEAQRVSVGGETGPLEIRLATVGGGLRLTGVDLAVASGWLLARPSSGAVAASGTPWIPDAGVEGSPAVILPNLAPGEWQILSPPTLEDGFRLLVGDGVRHARSLATFTIRPGETTELALD